MSSRLAHAGRTGRLAIARRSPPAIALLALLGAFALPAQEPASATECDDEARGWWRGNREGVCEAREITLPATGSLAVDGGANGGIEVTGAERADVLVRAQVHAWADDEEAAREIAGQVEILTDGGMIRAEGPRNDRRASWAVSYEILTPRDTDLDLEASNGGITIEDVRGDVVFETLNGGARLAGIGGNVRGHTTNGGLTVRLTGDTWDGEGLDVRTTNGGVRMQVPESYSARLDTGTVNGGVSFDFPVTVQGRIDGRNISTTLGEGGPLLRVRTVNGGVRVDSY